jgi:uncharacterized SAM-binding protein YcdF (DUF218 family)
VKRRLGSTSLLKDGIIDSLVFHRGDQVEATTLFVFGTMQNISNFAVQIKRLWDTFALTHVIISGYQGEAESIATAAFQLGVPAQAISLETYASNTFENVLFSRSLLHKNCPNQAIHILSKEHCALRCYLTFQRILPDWKVGVHTTDYLDAEITNWRSNPVFLRLVIEEIGKISTYLEAGDLAVPEGMGDKLELLIEARGKLARLLEERAECATNYADPPEPQAQPLLECSDSLTLLAYDARQDLVLFERRFSPAAARRGRMPTSLQPFSSDSTGVKPLLPAEICKALLPASVCAERIIFAGKFFPMPSLSLERTTLYCALVSPVRPQESGWSASLESIAAKRLPAMLIDGKSFDGLAFGAIGWFISAKPYLQHLANDSITKDTPCR